MIRRAASDASCEGATSRGGRAFRAPGRRLLACALTGVLVAMLLVHAFVAETFTVPSASMEPGYGAGDRIVVDKRHGPVHRGDVIVFSGAGSMYQPAERAGALAVLDSAAGWLGFRPAEQDYLKRVIGVGGDRVSVAADGRLRVNGRVVSESYRRGATASREPFDVTVPAEKLFVLGDNRDDSDDSRQHLGDPGGGFVAQDRVIGTVAWTYWRG